MEEEENGSIKSDENILFDFTSDMLTTNNSGLISGGNVFSIDSAYYRIVYIVWNPKEDITTYELALCIPFINRGGQIYEHEIDNTKSFFKHFDIHYTA